MGVVVILCRFYWLDANMEDGTFLSGINLPALLAIGIFVYFLTARVLRCRELWAVATMLGRRGRKS